MQQPPDDPWIDIFVLGLAAGSVVVWGYLFSRWLRRGRVLPFEPRRLVPWGPLAGLFAVGFVLVAVAAALIAGEPEPEPEMPSTVQAAERIVGMMMIEMAVTGAALALAVSFSGAGLRDLGLPEYVGELVGDVRLGFVACLAAVAPVYGLLIVARLLLQQLEEPPHHPLVEMVFQNPSFGVVLLASLAAVVVAPVCEEVVFRLLLQGWLEKWETRRASPRACDPPQPVGADLDAGPTSYDTPAAAQNVSVPGAGSLIIQPPRRGIFALPFGWWPIIISSLLFALAHFGYGPEPVPLFFLALILGYLYQRTHRIVPCIVTHALFNMITVVTLWRLVTLSPE